MNQKEQADFNEISARINKVKKYLNKRNTSYLISDLSDMIEDFITVKDLLGNLGSIINFLALQKAKLFLEKNFNQELPGVLLKDINTPGWKINCILNDGKRIVAEAKTTTPTGRSFGSKQREEISKVLDKLKSADADYKYLFVTNEETARILHIEYSMELVGITVEII